MVVEQSGVSVEVVAKRDGSLDDGCILYCVGLREGYSSFESAVAAAVATGERKVTIRHASNIGRS